MNIVSLVFFVLGLVLLIVGAEALVRGAVRIAAVLGISPLLIGLTVVAFGTSAPELAVSVQASLSGQTDVAVGNVVGSNILNVFLILGLSAAITPLMISVQLVRWDVPIMIGVSVFTLLLGLDGVISRLNGLVLVFGMIGYTVFSIRQGRKEQRDLHATETHLPASPTPHPGREWVVNGGLICGGLALLILGSRWLNDGAITIARAIGVSDLVIGLTLVAAGTSLPEVATSVLASLRGERDIAVGNVVGSNIFNVLAVLGLASSVAPEGIPLSPGALRLDIPIMIAVAVACLPIFFTDHTIARWEGVLFLGYYVAYTTYLILDSTQHEALPVFSTVMLVFVIPLTVIPLVLLTVRGLRAKQQAGAPD